jgi:hypothetical protein
MTGRSHRTAGPEPAMCRPLTSAFALPLKTGRRLGPADPACWAHGMCHGCAIGAISDDTEKLMTPGLTCGNRSDHVERVTRVELAFSAWEADVLPLNYTRRTGRD